jgi:hypothetical protein
MAIKNLPENQEVLKRKEKQAVVDMDPNACLTRLRELAAYLHQVANAVGVEPTEADRDVLVEFLDKARGLDIHLMSGGSLPAQWEHDKTTAMSDESMPASEATLSDLLSAPSTTSKTVFVIIN